MSTRVDAETPPALGTAAGALVSPPVVGALAFDDEDRFGGPELPNDHPAWLRDAVSLSQRARALVVRLKPIVMHVVGAWEHRVRTIVVAGRTVSVDASGSYRME